MTINTIDKLTVPQLREAVTQKTNKLAELWRQAGPDIDVHKIDELEGDTDARLETLNQMGDEVTEYKKQLDIRLEIDKAANKERMRVEHMAFQLNQPTGQPPTSEPQERIGDLYVKSDTYAHWRSSGSEVWKGSMRFDEVDPRPLMERKVSDVRADLFYTGNGFPPAQQRTGDIVPIGLPPIMMIDLVPQLETTSDIVRYVEQTEADRTNVAEKAEVTTYSATAADVIGQAAITYHEREQTVRWIPVFLPVSQMQLEDVPGIQGELNATLGDMIRAHVSSQMLVGTGAAPQILGTTNLTGLGSVAKGGDPVPDAVHQAMSNIRSQSAGREPAEPTAVVMHPDDWHNIRTLRTADGIYIWGNPATPGPQTLWGVNVVVTSEISQGTAIVGDYARFARLYVRRGITTETTDSHGTMFTQGQLAIRVSMRAAMVHRRVNAFQSVTGL